MTRTGEGIERAKIGLVMSAVLIVVLVVSSVWLYIRVDSLQRQVDSLQAQVDSLLARVPVFQHMPDATLSQTDPVSGTLYTVLGTVKNARIIGIAVRVTYTEAPTVECHINVDGSNLTASKADMTNNTWYTVITQEPYANPVYTTYAGTRAFLLEGRSVSITAEFSGGTGVSELSARVKYAIIP